ncbi:DUF3592 domain-containing protein [Luteolibacter sp. LG18]|uniref:DUF3592 domain-containing protein n=1 Tax=Luteolibacter sp. LG18 TaxID=2819286 RepID=UPI0030C668BB
MASGSVAGRLYLAMIGMALALAGSFFCWLMWRSYDRAHHMRAWPEVPCTILSSGIEERRIDPNSAPEFRFAVLYGYEWQGTRYTSTHWTWRESPWSSRRGAAEEDVKAYPVEGQFVCRVNPDEPGFAILKTDSQAPLYSIWFPALFVVGGLGIAASALFRKRRPA